MSAERALPSEIADLLAEYEAGVTDMEGFVERCRLATLRSIHRTDQTKGYIEDLGTAIARLKEVTE